MQHLVPSFLLMAEENLAVYPHCKDKQAEHGSLTSADPPAFSPSNSNTALDCQLVPCSSPLQHSPYGCSK